MKKKLSLEKQQLKYVMEVVGAKSPFNMANIMLEKINEDNNTNINTVKEFQESCIEFLRSDNGIELGFTSDEEEIAALGKKWGRCDTERKMEMYVLYFHKELAKVIAKTIHKYKILK